MVDAVAFSEVVDAAETPPMVDEVLVVEGDVGEDKFTGGVRLTVTNIYTIAKARARFAKYLLLRLTPDHQHEFESLRALLANYPGRCAVRIQYKNGTAEQSLVLPPQWHVLPEDHLLDALTQRLTPESVSMFYHI